MKINKIKEEKRKRGKFLLVFASIFLLVFLTVYSFPTISAQQSDATWCAEKTIDGAYCQNVPLDQVDQDFLSSPTNCDGTSFCQRGCCYDSDEGICAQNVPERACEVNNGIWSDSPNCAIPQCESGCCVLGTEASFTSLQRCKKLAGNFGLQADFRTDVADEIACIELATSQDVGACVFEAEFTRTCKFTTRGECNAQNLQEGISGSQFYENYLCTSQSLNTDCQKTKQTSCITGKDGVYFLDTCGNPANIYDNDQVTDFQYWERVVKVRDSCEGNARGCGNCDYLGGSICAKAERGQNPAYGDFICNDINCYDTDNGNDYINGESWCFFDNNDPQSDSIGSRYYRHTCFMGEELVEPCSDYRQEICFEGSIGEGGDSFAQAGCIPNRWQDCTVQREKSDCINSDKRDCEWVGRTIEETLFSKNKDKGICVPQVAPGLEFWNEGAQNHCSLASSLCVVVWEKGLLDDWECIENCHCLEDSYKEQQDNLCNAIGDCGPDRNYINRYIDEGYEFTIESDVQEAEKHQPAEPGGAEAPGTGNVIQGLVVKTYNFIGGNE